MIDCKNNIIYSPANEACCPNPEVVIDETCENLTNISETISVFKVSNPNGVYVSLTLITDINNTGNTGFGIKDTTLSDPINFVIPPGNSVTKVFKHVTEARVGPVNTGQTIDARLCIKVYNRIFLI